jgi:hypothetical protein
MEWVIYIFSGLVTCGSIASITRWVAHKNHLYYYHGDAINRLNEPYNSLLARKKFTSSDVKQVMNSSQVKPKPALEAASKAKALPASAQSITQKADNVRNSIRNSLLPTQSKQVASTIVNGSESLLEKTLTNEQEHIVETILFTHVPDLVELFSNLTTKERASLKQVERLTNQLSKLKGAILEVDEQVAKAARDKWETNEFYLDAKFPSSPELTTN